MSFWLGVSITLNIVQAIVFWLFIWADYENSRRGKR